MLIGWCGMRGLVTLATAFALPLDFPQRDLIVLTAFAVVLATLVVQGLSLGPLIRLLRFPPDDFYDRQMAAARVALIDAVLADLDDHGNRDATVRPRARVDAADRAAARRAPPAHRIASDGLRRESLAKRERSPRCAGPARSTTTSFTRWRRSSTGWSWPPRRPSASKSSRAEPGLNDHGTSVEAAHLTAPGAAPAGRADRGAGHDHQIAALAVSSPARSAGSGPMALTMAEPAGLVMKAPAARGAPLPSARGAPAPARRAASVRAR